MTELQKQIRFRSLENYSVVAYEEDLKKVNISNYENFININETYSNFIQGLTFIIFKVAPCKTETVKDNF